jgi:hypothetical protein
MATLFQAIVTRYIGPTNYRGSRVKATCEGGSIILEWNDALNSKQNHDAAAKALANKLDWGGEWHSGCLPDNRGNCYVQGDIGSGPVFCTYSKRAA